MPATGGCLVWGVCLVQGGSGPGRGCLVPGGPAPEGCPPATATAAGGSHPTGIHSCPTYFVFTGFGWYLDKVHIKDRGAGMQYFVHCDRWLSSREGDGRTFKDFDVTDSMTYNPGTCFQFFSDCYTIS